MKIDLIIQGKTEPYTQEVVDLYRSIPWVGKIIISCWEGDQEICADNLQTVRSSPITNNGIGNRNAQITTSQAGAEIVTSEFCAKLRSDQKISVSSMELMKDFMFSHPEKICVMSFYEAFPFHPRDHSFWGKTENIVDFFDIPHDPIVFSGAPPDTWPNYGFYNYHFRSECYITSQFLAKKEPRVKYMVDNPHVFLYDFAPRSQDAKDLDKEIMPKYFVPFPRIDMEWPKLWPHGYPYEVTKRCYGEYTTELT